MPATLDLVDDETCIYQGDVYELILTLNDDGDTPAPLDLSTGEWRAQIRAEPTATAALATFTIDTAAAADGELVARLETGDTGALGDALAALASSARRYRAPLTEVFGYWDLEDVDSETTYFAGRVKVKLEVTR